MTQLKYVHKSWTMRACVQVNKHELVKFDLLVFIVAAVAVMFAGVEIGLAISIGLSVVIALWKSAFPHTAVLGQLPDTTVYRCAGQLDAGCRVSVGAGSCPSDWTCCAAATCEPCCM